MKIINPPAEFIGGPLDGQTVQATSAYRDAVTGGVFVTARGDRGMNRSKNDHRAWAHWKKYYIGQNAGVEYDFDNGIARLKRVYIWAPLVGVWGLGAAIQNYRAGVELPPEPQRKSKKGNTWS